MKKAVIGVMLFAFGCIRLAAHDPSRADGASR